MLINIIAAVIDDDWPWTQRHWDRASQTLCRCDRDSRTSPAYEHTVYTPTSTYI